MSTPTEKDTRRLGAMAAILAMIQLKSIAEADVVNDTAEEYLHNRATAIRSVIDSAGEITPFLSGFIEALAAHVYAGTDGNIPNLSVWRPDVAMSEAELAKSRQEIYGFYAMLNSPVEEVTA